MYERLHRGNGDRWDDTRRDRISYGNLQKPATKRTLLLEAMERARDSGSDIRFTAAQ